MGTARRTLEFHGEGVIGMATRQGGEPGTEKGDTGGRRHEREKTTGKPVGRFADGPGEELGIVGKRPVQHRLHTVACISGWNLGENPAGLGNEFST